MIRKILFICMLLQYLNSFSIDSLDINNTVLNTTYPNKFTSVSSMALNEQIESIYDSVSTSYSTNMRDTVFSLIKPLHLKVLRFPGGTIGNYYHFYKNGYGIDTSETNCAPGRLGSDYANQSLSFDNRVNKNIIEYFIEEVDTLKQNGDSIGVAFRLNSHTHFYKGDLIRFSDSIQYLVHLYMNQDSVFLNSSGNSIDSTKINTLASKLVQLQSDAVIKRIKNALMNDASFMFRFKENFDAIDYLKVHKINILGIEIGNETDAEYIIYDDDLAYLGYDCTNIPDTFPVQIYNLPMKYYFEGLVKNWILISLYADSIKARYNIPVAVPAANGFNYLTLNSNYQPQFVQQYALIAKKADLWNKYYGLQPNIFALIPHIYSQSFMTCNTYATADTFGFDRFTLNKIAERFFKAYIDSVVTFNLKRINFYGNNKPLWVTEWNFTDASFATNTFFHAVYNYYFIRKAMEIHEFSPNYVQVWLYHFLVGAYHGWPLIRTSNNNQSQYFAEKQITYHPFYIWSNTMNQNVKRLKTPFWQNTNDRIIDAFINSSKNEMYIQYMNTDSSNHFISLNALKLKNGNQELSVEEVERYVLDAASFTSSNYSSCSYVNNQTDNKAYEIIEDKLNRLDSLLMPGLSIGKFTLHLKNKVATNVTTQKITSSKIFPNPTNHYVNIALNEFSTNDDYQYMIYSSIGLLSDEGNLNRLNNQIDVSNLPAGLYFIQIRKNNQLIENQKIIKN
jgi:hypothetical protein